MNEEKQYVPKRDPAFVPTKQAEILESILVSDVFCNTYLSGPSGVGKTYLVQQICAFHGKELIRLNFTEETSERDIIGGWRLKKGETVWEDGPAIIAMKRGAKLLLDEIDLSTAKAMCLQGILEGSPYHNKQTGEVVQRKHGFQIIATGNTKGHVKTRDSRFVHTKVLNEAFLDRFDFSLEQTYPSAPEEQAILLKFVETLPTDVLKRFEKRLPMDVELSGVLMDISNRLVRWAQRIRDSYDRQALQDTMSTRRLCAVMKATVLTGSIQSALLLTTSRFDSETRAAFLKFYQLLSTSDESKNESGEKPLSKKEMQA